MKDVKHSEEAKAGLKGMLSKVMFGKKKNKKLAKKAQKFVKEEAKESTE